MIRLPRRLTVPPPTPNSFGHGMTPHTWELEWVNAGELADFIAGPANAWTRDAVVAFIRDGRIPFAGANPTPYVYANHPWESCHGSAAPIRCDIPREQHPVDATAAPPTQAGEDARRQALHDLTASARTEDAGSAGYS